MKPQSESLEKRDLRTTIFINYFFLHRTTFYTTRFCTYGALTLRPPTLSPLVTTTQTLRPQNVTTQNFSDHVTLPELGTRFF
jgi:hypothetical protein